MSLPKNLSKEEKVVIARWWANGAKRFRRRIRKQTTSQANSIKAYSSNLTLVMNAIIDYIDKGVSGTGKGSWTPYEPKTLFQGSKYRFKTKPPRSAFEKYSDKKSDQFLMARSVGRFGIPRKKFLDKYIEEAFFTGASYEKFLDELAEANLNGIYKIFKKLEK